MLIACLMVFQVVGMLTYHLQSLPTIIALRPVLVWLPLVSHELHPSLGWAWERLLKKSFLSIIKKWVSHTRKQGTSLVREVTPCRCESYDSSFCWILKRLSKSLSIYNSSSTIEEKMIQTFCRMRYTRGKSTRKPPRMDISLLKESDFCSR